MNLSDRNTFNSLAERRQKLLVNRTILNAGGAVLVLSAPGTKRIPLAGYIETPVTDLIEADSADLVRQALIVQINLAIADVDAALAAIDVQV